MSAYTKKNLTSDEVPDRAAEFGLADHLTARFAREALDCEKSGLSYQKVNPGTRVPFGHKHGSQEEIYVCIAGSGKLKIEDDIVEIGHLDAVRVAPEPMRGIEAGPDGLELIVFGSSSIEVNDGDVAPGWWS